MSQPGQPNPNDRCINSPVCTHRPAAHTEDHHGLAFTLKNRSSAKTSAPGFTRTCPRHFTQVHNALHLTRDDMQRWAKPWARKAGWATAGPRSSAAPGWNAVQKHLFEEECAGRCAGAWCLRPGDGGAGDHGFGNAEQQQRFLPGIASGEVWWSQGYSEPGSGSDLASLKTRAERRATSTSSTARRPGPRWASTANGSSAWCAPAPRASPDRHQLPADRHEEPGVTVRPSSCWTAGMR